MAEPRMVPERRRPIQGPISAEAFFALREPAPGIQIARRLGLGTAGIAGVWGPSEPSEAVRTLRAAWSAGFLLVDTAPAYRAAEILVQRALESWSGPMPVIATKTKQACCHLEDVAATYQQSVERLDRIDMLALHDLPIGIPECHRSDLLNWLGQLADSGAIRAVGLGGGGPVVQAGWLCENIVRYLITYNRLDAVTLQGLDDTVPQARSAGAAVIAASPLHLGLLGPRGPIGRYAAPADNVRIWHERAARVRVLAQDSGVPLTHLALRFILSMPFVDFLLTGAATEVEWLDCRAAYESGPLPDDLYTQLWRNAQSGAEPLTGG